MVRPAAFQAMGQQHHQSGETKPFLLCGSDELVDDDLRTIGEVAELRLPADQGVWVCSAVAIFKPKHRRFRQWAVVNLERGIGTDPVQRRICLVGFLVQEIAVAL